MHPSPAPPQGDPAVNGSPLSRNGRLDSWKEIAAYLRRSVRTVIRWEQEEGLPVHRQSHVKRGTVYAYPDELDAWLASRGGGAALKEPEDAVDAPPPRRSPWRLGLALSGAALLMLAGAAWILVPRYLRPGEVALVVLPFVNEDAEPALEPLSDGIAEDLTRRLSRAAGPTFRVLAHSMVRGIRQPPPNLSAAAQRLGANTVLLGRYSERGGRLVVTAELLAAADATQIWSARYERQPGELQAIEEELSREIAAKLIRRPHSEQSQALTRRETPNAQAYREFLRGRFHWNQRTAAGLAAAIVHFQSAVAADPDYARAHAGLADAYALLSYYTPVAAAEGAPKARAAALRALELDGRLAEAYAALAQVKSDYYWDWRGAERDFLRAIELNPDYADGRHWYAEYLSKLGRYEEAVEQYTRAAELSPLSLIIATNLAHAYYFSRDYDRAIAICRQALALDPNFPNAHADLGRALLLKGTTGEAVRTLESAVRLDAGPVNGQGRLGYAYAAAGRPAEARRILQHLMAPAAGRSVSPLAVALVHLGLGRKDEALLWLSRAVDEHATYVASIQVDPLFDPLRQDPRFKELLARMNLTPQESPRRISAR